MEKTIINTITDLPGEEWRTVDFNDKVKVSNFGRVSYEDHKRTNIIMIQLYRYQLTTMGNYLKVNIFNTYNNKLVTKTIHQLVATYFIPNPDNLPEVNHKDGKKYNNRVDNLEWVTSADNLKHAKENKLQPINDGLPTPIIQLDINGNVINKFDSITSAAKILHMNRKKIGQVISGKANMYWGYNWVIDYERKPTYSNNKPIKIQQIDLNDNIINEYTSVRSAAKSLNIDVKCVHDVLNGTQKTTHGFKFKRVEN